MRNSVSVKVDWQPLMKDISNLCEVQRGDWPNWCYLSSQVTELLSLLHWYFSKRFVRGTRKLRTKSSVLRPSVSLDKAPDL